MLTRWLGVFGTVFGTLIALITINYMWGGQIVFKYYFKIISAKEYFIDNLKYSVVTLVGCSISYVITSRLLMSGIFACIISFVISALIFNIIYFVLFYKTNLFNQSKELLKIIISSTRGMCQMLGVDLEIT